MHLLIPYAAPASDACRAAMAQLQLPQLTALLRVLSPLPTVQLAPESLSAVAEHVQATAMGLPADDGLIPWAAWDAQRLGLTSTQAAAAWAHITPCHWQIHADHVSMAAPEDLGLSDEESSAFMTAMQTYFLEDGIRLHPFTTNTWLAEGEVFKQLPTASMERVHGKSVDAWMPRQAQAKTLRRLQNEMQMLLYTHPLNDARSARRQAIVNSFWVSGTGDLPDHANVKAQAVRVVDTLRRPAQQDHAQAWLAAWHALDAQELAPLLAAAQSGQAVQLTLCGELSAHSYSTQPLSTWARLARTWRAPKTLSILQNL